MSTCEETVYRRTQAVGVRRSSFLADSIISLSESSRKPKTKHSRPFLRAMATAICAIMTPLPTTSQQQQTRPAAPLRRATYVHVSDLTSAYNIDHARLEQELARVKATRDASTEDNPPTITDADDEATQTADIDAAMVNLPQKRLQPPRGGYNLCV